MWCLKVFCYRLSEKVDCINSFCRYSLSQAQKNLFKETVHIFCGRRKGEWSD